MKKALILIALVSLLGSCRWMRYKRVTGNGNITTTTRNVSHTERIKLEGSYEVEITQGATPSVRIEADENLMSYILTDQDGGFLRIHSREHFNLSTDHGIKVYIVTPKLEEVRLSGAGNVTGMNKFTGGDRLVLNISGAGDMTLDVNTPKVDASVAGSGTIRLKGETQEQHVQLSGVGDYKAEDLKSERSTVRITGAGNAWVFADETLDVHVAGVGSVYYKGSAQVTQQVAGAGDVKKIQ